MSAGDMVIVLDFQTMNRGLRGYQWTMYPPSPHSNDLWDPRARKDHNGDPQVWVSFDAVGVNSEFEPYGNGGLVQIRRLPKESSRGRFPSGSRRKMEACIPIATTQASIAS
jgi:hypothetical protein